MCNAGVRQYFGEIKRNIPCTGKRKRDILRNIDERVEEYLKEYPDARYADLTARFGTPDQIVFSCLEEMDAGELLQRLKIKRKIVGITAAAALAVVVLWTAVVSIMYVENKNYREGYFVEYVSNVTYGEQNIGG